MRSYAIFAAVSIANRYQNPPAEAAPDLMALKSRTMSFIQAEPKPFSSQLMLSLESSVRLFVASKIWRQPHGEVHNPIFT